MKKLNNSIVSIEINGKKVRGIQNFNLNKDGGSIEICGAFYKEFMLLLSGSPKLSVYFDNVCALDNYNIKVNDVPEIYADVNEFFAKVILNFTFFKFN